MEVQIDKDTCISCGLCCSIVEEIFEIEDDGKAGVIRNPQDESEIKLAKEAVESCPVNAITEY